MWPDRDLGVLGLGRIADLGEVQLMTSGAQTLVELLAEQGLMLKSYRAGHTEQHRCPKCEGGRTRAVSCAVTIDADADGAAWKCHRATCGWQGGGRVWHPGEQSRRPPPPAETRPTARPVPDAVQDKPEALYRFFEKRGIGADTVDAFGCYVATHWFPAHGEHQAGESPAIVFPYRWRGELVNRKYRPAWKAPQAQDKGALATLFNIDALIEEAPECVWWVEGEPDVMALHEAGYVRTVSLKDGAPAKLRPEDGRQTDDKRFAALETHAELLTKVKKFVIAVDMDDPGVALREELARRLGRHRCWLVTWPEGCKDAGDVLKLHGPEAVMTALEAAEPYPIGGLQHIRSGTLLTLRKQPPPPLMSTGCAATDAILHFPGEGRLIVITGIPSHGKTTWMMFVMIHLMRTHGRKFVVFSPEMQPWENFVSTAASVFVGKPFYRRKGDPSAHMDDTEVAHAEDWLRDRLVLLVSDAEDSAPTVDWLLDRARASVLRYGSTDLIIDPWNEVDHSDRGAMHEVEYIGRKLQQTKAFCFRHGVNAWVITHPKQQVPTKAGSKKYAPPQAYDISGGAMWANKTDLGITVHIGDDMLTEIMLWKPRFSRFGVRGSRAKTEFDPSSGRYRDPPIAFRGNGSHHQGQEADE